MNISVFGDTNVGQHRDHNEDAFIIFCDIDKQWKEIKEIKTDIAGSRGILFAVADGMGGANAGEVASALAVEAVRNKIDGIENAPENPDQAKKILTSIVHTAHSNIVSGAKKNKETRGMGTTLVLGWIVNNILFVAWSGDSRCYHYKSEGEQNLFPFTDDHSLVWSRVQQGEITPEEARLSDESNLILQALGDAFQKPEPEFKWAQLEKNDRIILCSDGLNSMLSDVGIQQILDFGKDATNTCKALIEAANNAGGTDNITVIVVDIIREADIGEQQVFSTVSRSSKNKRWLTLSLIILIALIAGVAVYITGQKLGYIKGFTQKEKPENEIPVKDTQQNQKNTVDSVAKNKAGSEQPSANTSGAQRDKPAIDLPSESKMTHEDSLRIIGKLTGFLNKIKFIEADINTYRKSDAEVDREFYRKNEERFEAILSKMNTLRKEINKVLYVRNKNSTLLVKAVQEKDIAQWEQRIKDIESEKRSITDKTEPPE